MGSLYDTVETSLIWGAVILIFGVISYLGYLQYLKMKRRRRAHRRRARRALRRASALAGEPRPSHHHQS